MHREDIFQGCLPRVFQIISLPSHPFFLVLHKKMTPPRFKKLQGICSEVTTFSTCHSLFILKKLWLETSPKIEIISRSKGIIQTALLLKYGFPPTGKEEPENQILVNFIYLWLLSGWKRGYHSFYTSKKPKKVHRGRGCVRRSVWCWGVSAGGDGHQNTSKPSSDKTLPRWVHRSQLLLERTRGGEGVKPRRPDPKPQVPTSPVFLDLGCTLESFGEW